MDVLVSPGEESPGEVSPGEPPVSAVTTECNRAAHV